MALLTRIASSFHSSFSNSSTVYFGNWSIQRCLYHDKFNQSDLFFRNLDMSITCAIGQSFLVEWSSMIRTMSHLLKFLLGWFHLNGCCRHCMYFFPHLTRMRLTGIEHVSIFYEDTHQLFENGLGGASSPFLVSIRLAVSVSKSTGSLVRVVSVYNAFDIGQQDFKWFIVDSLAMFTHHSSKNGADKTDLVFPYATHVGCCWWILFPLHYPVSIEISATVTLL